MSKEVCDQWHNYHGVHVDRTCREQLLFDWECACGTRDFGTALIPDIFDNIFMSLSLSLKMHFCFKLSACWYNYCCAADCICSVFEQWNCLNTHTHTHVYRCIQMWIVILEYWVSLSRDKSDRLICPVREWRVIGHIWPSVLWTVGTQAISSGSNCIMKHFRSSSTRLSSTDCDRVRHACLYLCGRKKCLKDVCARVCVVLRKWQNAELPVAVSSSLSAASVSWCLQHTDTLTGYTLTVVWLPLQFKNYFEEENVNEIQIIF